MTSTSEVLNEVAGRQITQCDVTTRLQLSGAWFDALSEIEDEALAAQAAAQEGLTVSDAELQNAVDEYRLSRELEKADDTHCWLESIGLSIEDVEQFLEADVSPLQETRHDLSTSQRSPAEVVTPQKDER